MKLQLGLLAKVVSPIQILEPVDRRTYRDMIRIFLARKLAIAEAKKTPA